MLIAPEIIGLERMRRVESALITWGHTTVSTASKTWTGERAAAIGPLRLLPDRPAPRERSTLWDVGDELGFLIYFAILGTPIYLFANSLTAWAVWGAAIASYVAGLIAILLLRSARLALLTWPLAVIGFPSHWGRALASDLCYLLLRALLSLGIRLLSGTDRLRALVFGTGVLLLFGGMAAQFAATF